MSSEHEKIQHSKRMLQKENYIKKQTKIAKAHGVEIKQSDKHRLQDHAAMNCGIPKCPMCGNPRKLFKELTIQEKKFYQDKIWQE
jgi:hypothetical protein